MKKIDLKKLTPIQETQFKVLKGKKGKDLKFEDLTEEQISALTGQPGDDGTCFKFEDLSPEQKAELTGADGNPLKWEHLTEAQKESLKGDAGEAFTWDQLTEAQKAELRPEIDQELIISGVLDNLKQHDQDEKITDKDLPKVVKDVLFKLNKKKQITALKLVYTDGNRTEWRDLATGITQQITNTVAPAGVGPGGDTGPDFGIHETLINKELTLLENDVMINRPICIDYLAGGGLTIDGGEYLIITDGLF